MNAAASGVPGGRYAKPVCLKGRLPFALAVPSFVFPASWSENAERLGPFVDEIELLLFESGYPGAFPDAREIDRLAAAGRRHALTYNVHLPIDVDPGSPDPIERDRAVAVLCQAIACTAAVRPTTHTLHLPVPPGCNGDCDLAPWHARVIESISRIRDISGIASRAISVETLMDPFSRLRPVIDTCDLSVCIDVGHLLLAGDDPVSVARKYRERIAIVHLHGVADDADHRSVAHLNSILLKTLLGLAADDHRTVCLELFSPRTLFPSMALLEKGWAGD